MFIKNFAEILQHFGSFLQNPAKIRTVCKFCVWSSAKECKSCTSKKTLQNEPFLAIVAVHTAENEPSKVGILRGEERQYTDSLLQEGRAARRDELTAETS